MDVFHTGKNKKLRPTAIDLRHAAELLEAQSPGSQTAEWLRQQSEKKSQTKPQRPTAKLYATLERLHELWQQEKTVYDIAESMGITVNYVTVLLVRARAFGLCPARKCKTVPRPPTGTNFPDLSLPIGLPMFGRYLGEFYEGTVHAGGIQVEGATYPALSPAAMTAVRNRCGGKRPLNGWDFWRIKLADGRESTLSSVRLAPDLLNQVRDPSPVTDETLVKANGKTLTWATFAAVNECGLDAARMAQIQAELRICGLAVRNRLSVPMYKVEIVR